MSIALSKVMLSFYYHVLLSYAVCWTLISKGSWFPFPNAQEFGYIMHTKGTGYKQTCIRPPFYSVALWPKYYPCTVKTLHISEVARRRAENKKANLFLRLADVSQSIRRDPRHLHVQVLPYRCIFVLGRPPSLFSLLLLCVSCC